MTHIDGSKSMDTFNFIVRCWIVFSALIFIILLKITAPYGRHARKGWGPIVSNRIGWILMEIPSLLIPAFYVFKYQAYLILSPQIIFVSLWIFHYFYRAILFPFRLKLRKDIPLSIIGMGYIFSNVVNSHLNMFSIAFIKKYNPSWIRDPRFLVGIILFYNGLLHPLHFRFKIDKLERKW